MTKDAKHAKTRMFTKFFGLYGMLSEEVMVEAGDGIEPT